MLPQTFPDFYWDHWDREHFLQKYVPSPSVPELVFQYLEAFEL